MYKKKCLYYFNINYMYESSVFHGKIFFYLKFLERLGKFYPLDNLKKKFLNYIYQNNNFAFYNSFGSYRKYELETKYFKNIEGLKYAYFNEYKKKKTFILAIYGNKKRSLRLNKVSYDYFSFIRGHYMHRINLCERNWTYDKFFFKNLYKSLKIKLFLDSLEKLNFLFNINFGIKSKNLLYFLFKNFKLSFNSFFFNNLKDKFLFSRNRSIFLFLLMVIKKKKLIYSEPIKNYMRLQHLKMLNGLKIMTPLNIFNHSKKEVIRPLGEPFKSYHSIIKQNICFEYNRNRIRRKSNKKLKDLIFFYWINYIELFQKFNNVRCIQQKGSKIKIFVQFIINLFWNSKINLLKFSIKDIDLKNFFLLKFFLTDEHMDAYYANKDLKYDRKKYRSLQNRLYFKFLKKGWLKYAKLLRIRIGRKHCLFKKFMRSWENEGFNPFKILMEEKQTDTKQKFIIFKYLKEKHLKKWLNFKTNKFFFKLAYAFFKYYKNNDEMRYNFKYKKIDFRRIEDLDKKKKNKRLFFNFIYNRLDGKKIKNLKNFYDKYQLNLLFLNFIKPSTFKYYKIKDFQHIDNKFFFVKYLKGWFNFIKGSIFLTNPQIHIFLKKKQKFLKNKFKKFLEGSFKIFRKYHGKNKKDLNHKKRIQFYFMKKTIDLFFFKKKNRSIILKDLNNDFYNYFKFFHKYRYNTIYLFKKHFFKNKCQKKTIYKKCKIVDDVILIKYFFKGFKYLPKNYKNLLLKWSLLIIYERGLRYHFAHDANIYKKCKNFKKDGNNSFIFFKTNVKYHEIDKYLYSCFIEHFKKISKKYA